MTTITIDGSNFSDLESFYNEIDAVMTKDLGWNTGHNLNAFNDILRGGFGVYEYGEPIKLVWKNFIRSKELLDTKEIEVLIEIIGDHDHIDFQIVD